jgi:hypothetical protein
MIGSSPDHVRGETGGAQIDTTQNHRNYVMNQCVPSQSATANRTALFFFTKKNRKKPLLFAKRSKKPSFYFRIYI